VRANPRRPEYGLPIRAETPGGAPATGCVLAHGAATAPRSGDRTPCGYADNGASSDRRYKLSGVGNKTMRATVDNKRQEGQGVPKGVPAIGRETLCRANPKSAAGTKQDRQGDGGNEASSG
jgi:hypothetical protein